MAAPLLGPRSFDLMVEKHDAVHHPAHYTTHPSGVECIAIVEHMTFNVGSAVKYLWRLGKKDDAIQELEKARWYIYHEIERSRAEQDGEGGQ